MEERRIGRGWHKIALILFAVAVVGHGLAERRPETLYLSAVMVMIFLAVIGFGWLFANRRR